MAQDDGVADWIAPKEPLVQHLPPAASPARQMKECGALPRLP
jgi:hypothetical protein